MPEYGIDAILLFMKFICSGEHGSPLRYNNYIEALIMCNYLTGVQ